MEIKTYTRIWNTPRTLYSFGDIQLPRPVSVITAVVFLAAAAIWVPIAIMLFSPSFTSASTVLLLLGPPGLAAWAGNKPIFEDKNIIHYLMSIAEYLQEPKEISDLAPEDEETGTEYRVTPSWWEPKK